MLHHHEEGQGEAVVLLHGFAVDGRMWGAQRTALARRRRVLVPDLPGCGPGGDHTGEVCAAVEVARLLDDKGIDAAFVVGHSLGGSVAVDLALAYPERVRALLLVDAILLSGGPPGPEQLALAELAQRGDLPAARAAWFERPAFAPLRRSPSAAAALRAMIDDYRGHHWLGTLRQTWLDADHASRLPSLRLPVGVIVGSLDVPPVQAMAEAYASRIAGARLEVLEGVGHVPPLEDPEGMTRRIEAWLPA